MGISQLNIENVKVRLARSEDEMRAAQHLRYKVFYEEYGAIPDDAMRTQRRDFDRYDDVTDHLIVIDESIADPAQRIVGTYRLLRRDVAEKFGAFYTSSEYDIAPILDNTTTPLELGRSCVLAEYRTRPVLQLLWQGITDYMHNHNIELMFGCASLHGTDVAALAVPLSYLYHYHLTPGDLRPRALESRYVDMNILPKDDINPKTAFIALPPLIKGYLRLGATIGDGAVVDEQFNTVDVCIVLRMSDLASRYRDFYERKLNRQQEQDAAKGAQKALAGGAL